MAANRRAYRAGHSTIRWMRADSSGLQIGLYCGHQHLFSIPIIQERPYILDLTPGQRMYCQQCPSTRSA